ncbi:histidine kinase dimerization/phospho-acceptor domain-containing protein [Caulobacter segnis]
MDAGGRRLQPHDGQLWKALTRAPPPPPPPPPERFSADASHQLRTPLSVIVANLALLGARR